MQDKIKKTKDRMNMFNNKTKGDIISGEPDNIINQDTISGAINAAGSVWGMVKDTKFGVMVKNAGGLAMDTAKKVGGSIVSSVKDPMGTINSIREKTENLIAKMRMASATKDIALESAESKKGIIARMMFRMKSLGETEAFRTVTERGTAIFNATREKLVSGISSALRIAGNGGRALLSLVSGIPIAGPALAVGGAAILGSILVGSIVKGMSSAKSGKSASTPKLPSIGDLIKGDKAEKEKKKNDKEKKSEERKNKIKDALLRINSNGYC
ncbi:hypothetical protein FPHOBKDP_00098 [Listeria phage LPJP1]|nr:hypothetical protein FPHOBKDP_00098 [Listeria phage LPJP1]